MNTIPLLRALVASVLLAAAPLAGATPMLFWDFENSVPALGGSSSVGLSFDPDVAGLAFQTGGGPAENFGAAGLVHLTRFFGSAHPVLEITNTRKVVLESIEFEHFHNHNPGFSTSPNYLVQVQLDIGAGFFDVGAPVLLSAATNGTTASVGLGGLTIGPGSFQLRWDPRGLNPGAGFPVDTNTEFFALNDVQIDGLVSEPGTLALTGFLVALAFAPRARRRA